MRYLLIRHGLQAELDAEPRASFHYAVYDNFSLGYIVPASAYLSYGQPEAKRQTMRARWPISQGRSWSIRQNAVRDSSAACFDASCRPKGKTFQPGRR
jgi:hypothetical protein